MGKSLWEDQAAMRCLARVSHLSCLFALACGAPAKPASEVSSIFSKAETLQDIESAVCSHIAQRTDPPTTQGLSMDLQGCKRAGEGAQNYVQVSQFQFVNIDGTTFTAPTTSGSDAATKSTSGDPKVVRQELRAQIWLNKSILDLASILSNFMKSNKSAGAGEIQLPDSSLERFKNLAQTKITMTEPPTLDIDNLALGATVELQLEGVVKAYQKIEINGKLFDRTFIVVARPVVFPQYKDSILHSIELVIFLTPYAGDTYVDLFAAVNIYDVGVQAIVNEQLSTLMSTMIKSTIDSIMAVRG